MKKQHVDQILLLKQNLQDVVYQYKKNCSRYSDIDEFSETQDIAEQAILLRAMILDMGTTAPACFTDRIVSLALEIDPPFPYRMVRH